MDKHAVVDDLEREANMRFKLLQNNTAMRRSIFCVLACLAEDEHNAGKDIFSERTRRAVKVLREAAGDK